MDFAKALQYVSAPSDRIIINIVSVLKMEIKFNVSPE